MSVSTARLSLLSPLNWHVMCAHTPVIVPMCVGNVAKVTVRPVDSLSTYTPSTVRNLHIHSGDGSLHHVLSRVKCLKCLCNKHCYILWLITIDSCRILNDKHKDYDMISFFVPPPALCQTCQSPTTVRSAVWASRHWRIIGSTSRSSTLRSSTSVQLVTKCSPVPSSWKSTKSHTLEPSPSAVTSATSPTR